MAFMSGGVQKDLDWKHLFRHSASSSWGLPYLINSLSMQALAKSSNCDQSFLLRSTWVFSLVIRIYRPQYTERVCCGSPSSCISFLGISMSPEWNTASRLTLRDQKEFQSSLPVWGHHHWGRWRHTSFVARWVISYVEVTPVQSSGIH